MEERQAGTQLDSTTRLRGAWLWIARGLWLIVCSASVALFLALLPINVREIRYNWQVEAAADWLHISRITSAYDTFAITVMLVGYLALVVFVAVAIVIAVRRSNDWMALLVSATLLLLPHVFNLGGYTESYYYYPAPFDRLLGDVDMLLSTAGIFLLLQLFFIFPDGRFVPRWTIAVGVAISVLLLLVLLRDYLPAKIGDDRSWSVLMGLVALFLLLAALAQVYRYRQVADKRRRQPTRWVVVGWVAAVGGFFVVFALQFIGSPVTIAVSLPMGILVPTVIPVAFAMAMTRDRLWSSDPLLNRALVYGALTAILVGVYFMIVGLLSAWFHASNNFLVAAAATGAVALLFQPLRARVQREINRLMYGERDEPFAVLNRLGAQLEQSLTSDNALALLVDTIGRALHVPYAAIVLNDDDRAARIEYGRAIGDEGLPISFPIKYRNETVGELVVARRAPGASFSSADLQLVETLVRQAGAAAYAARLYSALEHSRERVITEREQERRRLRRDLHDGLGPTLASQTLRLEAALDLITGEDAASASARRLLQDIKKQMQATVGDIRRIVYELRPPALDDLGLVGALRAHLAQADGLNGLSLAFDAPSELPTLSAAVQVNAYRIIVEAVTNAVRHGQARACRVVIHSEPRLLHVLVQDDGVGFDPAQRRGVGVLAMRERAAEVGGTCEIETSPGQGTRVTARLPVGEA